jgi:hypothetical protein
MYYGKLFSRSYTVKVVATVFATPTGSTEGTVVASTATNRLYGRNNSLATPPTSWMGATVITGATVVVTNWLNTSNSRNGSNSP